MLARVDHDVPWRSELLLSLLDPPASDVIASLSGLEQRLAAMIEAGAAAWPAIDLPPEQYLAHLAHHLHDAGRFESMHASDLYIAAACARGDTRAIETCVKALGPALEGSLAKIGASATTIDETRQILLEYLFVGAHPAIATYAGRGELRSWVRSIGVRTCRRLMGSEQRIGDGLDDIASKADPEIDLLKSRYREEFRAAFDDALATLEPRERNLIRQHYIDGLSIDKLAALYHVHRATSARWVATARRRLFEGTREAMIRRLGVGELTLDSILRLIRSQLETSIHDTLG
jgi:RNA polymerase sigma-70 factor (ECF subfamily)